MGCLASRGRLLVLLLARVSSPQGQRGGLGIATSFWRRMNQGESKSKRKNRKMEQLSFNDASSCSHLFATNESLSGRDSLVMKDSDVL
jgi:hypothetical protein